MFLENTDYWLGIRPVYDSVNNRNHQEMLYSFAENLNQKGVKLLIFIVCYYICPNRQLK